MWTALLRYLAGMDVSSRSLDQTFDRFIDEIALTPDELMAARASAAEVAGILRRSLSPSAAEGTNDLNDHLVSGGVGKRTAIHPLESVDMLYLLPADDTAITLLQDTLAATYGDLIVTPDRFLVTARGITVCIRPAIDRQGLYAIPGEGGWVTSNPIAEMAALRVADSVSGSRTTRLLMLLKAWKTSGAVPLPSFALEIMAREFMTEYGDRPWAELITDFLAWSRQRTPASFDLPGGVARLAVDGRWHPQAEAAYWRCVLAGRHAASGDRAAAQGIWRHLLGPRFGAPPRFNMWNVKPDLGQDVTL